MKAVPKTPSPWPSFTSDQQEPIRRRAEEIYIRKGKIPGRDLAPKRPAARSLSWKLLHLGAFGLFVLTILDSSPIPTFGAPDILIAVLSASHRNPWYEYAATAAAGSMIGAYITFRLARKAGS